MEVILNDDQKRFHVSARNNLNIHIKECDNVSGTASIYKRGLITRILLYNYSNKCNKCKHY